MGAAGKPGADLNAIIQADREKRKRQQLADQIFGNGRRSSAPGVGNGRKPPTGPASLASRMGISKTRTPSASPSLNGNKKPNDARPGRPQALQRAVSTPQLNQRNHSRNQALASIINGGSSTPSRVRNQANVTRTGQGISIRGVSTATYTVVAQNFALGTTAADIEAVLVPDAIEAGLTRCRLVASNPTVIAEVVLTNKVVAEEIIATFNNKRADGRLLYVYMKDGIPNPYRSRAAYSRAPAPVNAIEDDEMDYDDGQQQSRTAARAEPDVQDGRYGFSETDYTRSESSYQEDRQSDIYDRRGRGGNGGGGRLVSDNMLRRDNGSYSRR